MRTHHPPKVFSFVKKICSAKGVHFCVLQSSELEGNTLNKFLRSRFLYIIWDAVSVINFVFILEGKFEKFDRDKSGKIDACELSEALLSLGFRVSPAVLELLVSKFDKPRGKSKAVEYDNFIEYD